MMDIWGLIPGREIVEISIGNNIIAWILLFLGIVWVSITTYLVVKAHSRIIDLTIQLQTLARGNLMLLEQYNNLLEERIREK